jgi:metallo-beta-lactamase class B
MKNKLIPPILLLLTVFKLVANEPIEWVDKNIGITQLTNNTYLIQTSYSCNGHLDCNHLLVIDRNDIVLVNTPATDSLTAILLDRIEDRFKKKVTKLVVSHFHDDSSGGLQETSKRGITSYGSIKTSNLLKSQSKYIDTIFADSLKITLQTTNLFLHYLGAGHSIDNIITWLPSENVLFGGCLLKSVTATDKGNIKDADILAWPVTIQKAQKKFANAKIVIPGHAAVGDFSIFDHTIKTIEHQ